MPFRKGEAPPNKDRTFPAEPLTAEEVTAILAQCSRTAPTGVRDRALITLLYRATLRIGETLALKPSDVDMRGGTVRVLHGKGDKARTVGIGDGVLDVLQVWTDCRRKIGFRGGALFCVISHAAPEVTGRPVKAADVRAMLRRRAAAAGIDKRVHPHVLRHSRAFEMSQEGVPVPTIQKQLGHSSLAVTNTYLNHLAPADVIALGRADTWKDG